MPYVEMLQRIGTALILGGLIGWERQRLDRPAGLRTHLLVALAAVTFMLVSTQFVPFQHYERFPKGGLISVDTSRIASTVVMGLGFLGAGTIARRGRNVQGLTTAASLWLVTALGLAAGAGMFVLAWTAGLLSLFVLMGLRILEGRGREIHRRVLVVLDDGGAGRSAILDHARASGARWAHVGYDRDTRAARTLVRLDLRLDDESRVEPLLAALETLPGVSRVSISTPGSGEGG
ncbi:MAG TPA: MgtC/SapB family protein [Isosphaeraceae bacterium]|jgi:putative Mg2+ transporter-C (MgtC) family protein